MGVCFCESSVKQREPKPNSGRERETAVEGDTQETSRQAETKIERLRERGSV